MPTFEALEAFLKNKTVGIAGAGGLGSNCAMAQLLPNPQAPAMPTVLFFKKASSASNVGIR